MDRFDTDPRENYPTRQQQASESIGRRCDAAWKRFSAGLAWLEAEYSRLGYADNSQDTLDEIDMRAAAIEALRARCEGRIA